MDHSQVIIRPVVSEKSYVLATADKYTFRVHKDAHKTQIKQAVEALFDVTVVEVQDYIASPKANGYRSLHLTIEVPAENVDLWVPRSVIPESGIPSHRWRVSAEPFAASTILTPACGSAR